MPNDLINSDPIVAQNFFLEIDGSVISMLSGVSGLDVEVDVVTMQQAGPNGKVQTVKTLGSANKAPDLQLTRMAPADAMGDAMWKWFTDIQGKGMAISSRGDHRKNGSIVLYDSSNKETGRFNFTNGWPSKISTDSLSVDSNEALKETITLVCERIERVK
jgi:phage tail-like protein